MRTGVRRASRPAATLAAAAAAAILAGCGSGGPAASGTSSATPGAGSSPNDSLALSHMKVLTRLSRSQLCGAISAGQAAHILRTTTGAPAYQHESLGNTCEWVPKKAQATGTDMLYIGISTLADWTGAQAIDRRLLHTTAMKIGGHPALVARPQGRADWAQVDLALGGDHDPVAEYRAPTLAMAIALAKDATPHILARG
jgi:hypothetical protein